MQHLIQVDLPRIWKVVDRLRAAAAAAAPPPPAPAEPPSDSNVDGTSGTTIE
jgi:hypothetical protein